MKVRELLTSNVKSCRPESDLAEVATTMWDNDCGVVPIVDADLNVIGIVTDRDICIAAATRSTSPSNIRARDVIGGEVYAVRAEDAVRGAMRIMREQRVRRLPVLDENDRLVGIISLNDLVAHADCRKGAAVSGEEFLETMKAICSHATAPVSA